jgi:predicted DsbA family dithiol-disulfide isomerase
VLLRLAAQVGLDVAETREMLASDTYTTDVRQQEQFYQNQGIRAVPAVIINDRHLIEGGQPVEVFERALRQIAEQGSEPA